MNEESFDQMSPEEFDRLADFACFMLGRDRANFIMACHSSSNLNAAVDEDCRSVWDRWQEWLEDYSREHNS